MSELIVDKERGLTALDMLSTTYKKATQIARKSSKAALSLILVFFAFLGFNSMPMGSENSSIVVEDKAPVQQDVASPISNPVPSTIVRNNVSSSPVVESKKSNLTTVNAKATALKFAGLDKSGIPTGWTVTDSTGSLGSLYFSNREPLLLETELRLSQLVKTDLGAANIFLSQTLVSDSSGLAYTPSVSYGKNGSWAPLVTKVSFLESERLMSGNYLVTAIIKVESELETSVAIPATASGRDLDQAPRQVITRLVLNQGKTQILAQAVYVVEKGAK